MRLLLTDSGITNQSIKDALIDLLGKPIEEATALCIPTAAYGHPDAGPTAAWQWLSGQPDGDPVCVLGWKSIGVLELTALPSIDRKHWVPLVEQADALLVGGGDATYLYHWLRESGLADLLPSADAVWVGMSAGSMVMTPRIGAEFVAWDRPDNNDQTLGVVDFAIFPHTHMPSNSLAEAEKWAAGIGMPSYATDYDTAIKVTDGKVEVISEGHWTQFPG